MGVVNRRISTLIVALVPIVAFLALLSFVTVPFVSLGPGPTFDTLGEVEQGDGQVEKQVVDIKGTDKVHPTSGHLNMTTVSQSDGLSMGQALALWLSGREQLVPRDLVYPPGKSKDEVDTVEHQGLQELGGQRRIRGAVVSEVSEGGHRRAGQRPRTFGGQAARTATPSTW